jgi:hypothetical protein
MNIADIAPEKFFYVADGSLIKNLQELPDALRNMSPDTFSHHVNEQKNDFHCWVKDVFQHQTLARKIKTAKNKDVMAKKVFTEIFS